MRYVGMALAHLSIGLVTLFTSAIVGLALSVRSVNADHVASSLREKERPRGHLQPLGEHRPAEGVVTIVDGFLEPRQFYEDHVLASKPVLFRRAAHDLPAFQRWSDTYLK